MSALATLRPNQLAALTKVEQFDGRLGIFAQKRTGKTRVPLAFIEKEDIKRSLVLVKNNFLPAWMDEAEKSNFERSLVPLVNGSIYERAMQLRALHKSDTPALVATTYDAWWRTDLRAAIREYWKPDLVIYDEAQHIIERSNHSARFAHQIANRESWFKYALALTATWQESGFEDLFSLFKAFDPTVFGKDFAEFAIRHCKLATHQCRACKELLVAGTFTLDRYHPCHDNSHKGPYVDIKGTHIVGYNNLDELLAKVRLHSYYLTQAEANIPQPQDNIITIQLSPATRKQYDEFMKKDVYTFTGMGGDELELFSRIPLTKLVKAQELTGGWVQDDTNTVLDISDEKLAATLELAKMTTGPLAIFCNFNHDAERIAAALHIPLSLTYTGLAGTGKKGDANRHEALVEVRKGNLPAIIGTNQMISEGLDLSCCAASVFYSHNFSSIKYDQLTGRDQAIDKHPIHYHLIADKTVDNNIYTVLSDKLAKRYQTFHKAPEFKFRW